MRIRAFEYKHIFRSVQVGVIGQYWMLVFGFHLV